MIASRDELRQPYFAPLLDLMARDRLVKRRLSRVVEENVSRRDVARARPRDLARAAEAVEPYIRTTTPSAFGYRIGEQIGARRRLHPVLGLEQDRLRRMRLDEGPRLVRGVAGSGKTLVAVRWAIRSLIDAPANARVLFVFGNQALSTLIHDSLAEAAEEVDLPFPDMRLDVRHAGDVLIEHTGTTSLRPWAYDDLAGVLEDKTLEPVYDALFIDEAQDFGEAALRQLFRLVREHPDANGSPRKALRIFYDDAQQVYGRGRPNWAALGVDLRGRSVVMRESYRSTRAIGELAMNVLATIEGENGAGLMELVDDQLVVLDDDARGQLLRSRHHLFDGPLPSVHVSADRAAEWDWVTRTVERALVEQAVRPADLKVIAMHDDVRVTLHRRLARALEGVASVDLVQRGKAPSDTTGAVELLTPHAMKGYEAEMIFVVAADGYCSKGNPLPRVLYTAMTRARSLLSISGTRAASGPAGDAVLDALSSVRTRLATMHDRASED